MAPSTSRTSTQSAQGWTREQLLVALRLYMRSPFGRLHQRNPEIIELATKIGRSPSALAMKACNFASLDPGFRATNRAGLSGASNADRLLWQEFQQNPEAIALNAESTTTRMLERSAQRDHAQLVTPKGDTDVLRTVRARRVQSFFRDAVLTSYESRCAISGLPIRELLVASHIIPWSKSIPRRADPTNGLCLVAHLDRAFDRGLIAIAADLTVMVSKKLLKQARSADLDCSLLALEGRPIRKPYRLSPDPEALAYHRSEIFGRAPQ